MVSVQFLFVWHDTNWTQIDLLCKDGTVLGGPMVKQDAYDPNLLNVHKATVNTLYRSAYEQTGIMSNEIDACVVLACCKTELMTDRLFPYVNPSDPTDIVYHYLVLCTSKPATTSGQWLSLHETNRTQSHRIVEYANRFIQRQKKRTLDRCTDEPMIHPDPYQQYAPTLTVLPMPYPALSYLLHSYVAQSKPLVDKTNVLAFSREELEEVVSAMEKGMKIELVFPTLRLNKKGDFYSFQEVRAYVADPLVHERWKRVFAILWRYPSSILFPSVDARDKMMESLTALTLAALCEHDKESTAMYTQCAQWLGGYWDKNVILLVRYECTNDISMAHQLKTIIQSLNVVSAPYHVQRIRSLLLSRTPPEEIVQMGIRNQLLPPSSPKRVRRKSRKMKKKDTLNEVHK